MEKGYTKTDGDWIFRYNENDQLHCENGPAAEDFKDGTKHWFVDNQRHRIGGLDDLIKMMYLTESSFQDGSRTNKN